MSAFAPTLGDPPSIAMIAPARLQVDPSYQRSLESAASTKLVRSIAEAWDWRLCVPLIVSRRGEALFVIDGQHRAAAATMRGDIPFLPCAISSFASPAEEAQLFVAANRRRRAINRVDEFRAAVAAGDEKPVAIDAAVRAAGLSIAARANNVVQSGELNFTSTLIGGEREFGMEIVTEALRVLGWAYSGETFRAGAPLFFGIAQALRHVGPPLVAAVLGTRRANAWAEMPEVQTQRGVRSQGFAIANLIRSEATKQPSAPPPPPTKLVGFEAQLAKVRGGARLVEKPDLRPKGSDRTMGGIGSAML